MPIFKMLSHKKGWTGAVRHVHRMYSFVLFNDILIFATIISENPRRGTSGCQSKSRRGPIVIPGPNHAGRLKGRLDLLHTAVDDNISDENDTSFVISSTSDPSKPSLFILAKTVWSTAPTPSVGIDWAFVAASAEEGMGRRSPDLYSSEGGSARPVATGRQRRFTEQRRLQASVQAVLTSNRSTDEAHAAGH